MSQSKTHRLQASWQLTQLDRLRNLAAVPGSAPKRFMRVSFFLLGSALRRIPGFNDLFRTIAPGAWSWFDTRQNAYKVLAKRTRLQPFNRSHEFERPSRQAGAGPLDRRFRKIHQFHSGSATGDAITNSMFLMQRTLRGLGYDSEIFVEHRDPALAERLLEVRDLPLHADYVLIVHHSMGYDICDWIASLPAKKVLMYHNITPPEFLSDAPVYAKYARIGREQLDLLRDNVVTALADSEYNAIELRERGYKSAVACPFLFDVDDLLKKAGPRPERAKEAPFTVLFVGRIIGSKGQADLVDAFAEFRRQWSHEARLVLVGRIDSPDDAYLQDIKRRIATHGLGDNVVLTGAVSDDELRRWYAQADAYVSLSLHEGFGVPLVEAMVHGVPVIAWPAGAVPYTLGGAAKLLADRSTPTVATAIFEIASNSERTATQVAEQYRVLDRFRITNALPHLIDALLKAGAAPPPSSEESVALANNLYLAIEGHTNGSYSLASVNRTLALAVERYFPGRARLISADGADPAKTTTRDPVDALLARPAPPAGPEIVISQHYPVRAPQDRGDCTLAMVFWEESLLPRQTVEVLDCDFDGVLAPSASTAKALIDSGVSIPVRTVGFAPDLSGFEQLRPASATPQHPLTFLHTSSCFPRKGVDVLLAAFAKAFRNTDPVRLVIKGFPNIHNDATDQIARLKASDPGVAEITMINEDIDDDAMRQLFAGADVMVLPTRGEGFNIPAAEAMAAGLPLIVTGYGGHVDFCTADEARLIDFSFAPSVTHLQSTGSSWVEPDLDDLTSALREAFDDLTGKGTGQTRVRSERAKTAVCQRLDDRLWVERVRSAAIDIMLDRPRALRISWISTWDVECGIAEYSNFLLESVVDDYSASGELTILCDDRTPASAPGALPRVRPCWNGRDKDASELARAVSVSDPDVLVIQHQPGLISWQRLVGLLTDPRVRNRAIVVTFHAAQRLSDLDPAEQASIVAALRNVSRILVHRLADVNFFKGLGLVSNVTLFPQGAPAYAGAAPVRPLTTDQAAIVGCYGFFLPGKGIDRLIEAAARLRQTWPKLRLRLINAEYSDASLREVSRCQQLARRLGIADAVDWDTTFHPHEESLRRLRQCDLIVLPYEESRESSSAALRSAMASGVPVAVTPVSIFEEAAEAIHRFARNDVEAIASGVDGLLRDEGLRRQLQQGAEQWLAERSWHDLSRRLFGMLNGLAQARRDGH
jgi:glycosyltransferase involved in cell wall biosynthesis